MSTTAPRRPATASPTPSPIITVPRPPRPCTSPFNPVNDAPVIVSPNGGAPATVAIAENTTAVTDVDATDADSTALSYSILPTAGTDFAKLAIDPVTGALSFIAAPDFEHPTDIGGADGDNAYVVEVQVSDGQG